MAFFRRTKKVEPAGPPLEHRLDWRLMQNGAIALYHKGAVLNEDVAWFQQAGYRVHSLDATRWSSAAAFHADVKRALAFPDYYGNNLAAWIDCLAELDVPDDGGVVLALRGYDIFARAEPDLAQIVLDSIESTSRRFLLSGRRLVALVQSGDPRIKFERVGAVAVTWNPREWLDADRGLRGGS